jgi:3-oxoadipate enol-lactonase
MACDFSITDPFEHDAEVFSQRCGPREGLDHRDLLPGITSPTLVIAGRHDMATPLAAGEFIRSQIPGASLTILDAAHISNVEQPHAFTDTVIGFLMQR